MSLDAAPVQWTIASGGNGHFYDLTPTTMNWDSAEAFAVSQGGHLVSINSAAEEAFLISTYFSGVSTRLIAWIGLSDAASEGAFRWTTDEPVTYTNWHPIEPNNFGDEDYVAMNWYFGNGTNDPIGQWNDTHINGTTTPVNPSQVLPYRGIIEIAPIPEPSTALFGLALTAFATTRRGRSPRTATSVL